MTSRATTLANAVVTALSEWDQLPDGATVSRVRNVTVLISSLTEAAPMKIAVIVAKAEDQSNRADVAEDIVLGICVVARCANSNIAASDAWEDFTELLRDYLRTNSAFKRIGSYQRKTVSTITVCDAEILDQSQAFVSATEATWFVSVGNRS